MEIRICGGRYVCCELKCDTCIETKSGIASIPDLEKRDAFIDSIQKELYPQIEENGMTCTVQEIETTL